MNQITQSDIHPDTESLNAFVEQALPAAEREHILAHMATCSRCRQVVYLAQQAGVGPLEPAIATAPQAPPPRRPWLASWRVAWIPAAALAGLVGFAVLHHAWRAPEQEQVARNVPSQPAPVAAPTQPEPAKSDKASAPATRDKAPAPKDQEAKQKPQSPPVAAPSPLTASQQNSLGPLGTGSGRGGSSYAGLAPTARLDAPQKPSSLGGPMAANQFQQQNANANQQQSPRQQLQSAGIIATGANRKEEAADKKETKIQTADAVAANAPVTTQVQIAQLAKNTDELATSEALPTLRAKSAKSNKATILPNGTAALSIAAAEGRTIAVDPSGNVFLIESPAKQWIPISPQWTGRAILVRARPVQLRSGIVSAPSAPLFELINDNIQTWVSFDGKTWLPQTMPPK